MIEGGIGGNKTQTGLLFERQTDLESALLQDSEVTIKDDKVYKNGEHIGTLLQKYKLYTHFLSTRNVDWREVISKRLLPDEAYFHVKKNRLIIIEKKYQQVAGSVDEKLQTCGFKINQYRKLCASIPNLEVEYIYIFNDWFKNRSYKDVLEYIEEVGCSYYFNEIPMEKLGL